MRKSIIDVCRLLNQKNLIAAADGNISFRISDREILMTPTARNKAFIAESDIATIDIKNAVLAGQPSGERLMHLEVYRNCPQAMAIVHAHPPTALAWTLTGVSELPSESLSEVILAVGRIPVARYARPGTESMGEALREFLPEHRVILLAHHGAISWGESLEEAYNGIERVEAVAQILKAAKELGTIRRLPATEIKYLRDLRKKLGPQTL